MPTGIAAIRSWSCCICSGGEQRLESLEDAFHLRRVLDARPSRLTPNVASAMTGGSSQATRNHRLSRRISRERLSDGFPIDTPLDPDRHSHGDEHVGHSGCHPDRRVPTPAQSEAARTTS